MYRIVPLHIQVTELVKHLPVWRQHAFSEYVRRLLWQDNTDFDGLKVSTNMHTKDILS